MFLFIWENKIDYPRAETLQSYSNVTRGDSPSFQATYFFKAQYVESPEKELLKIWLSIKCEMLNIHHI